MNNCHGTACHLKSLQSDKRSDCGLALHQDLPGGAIRSAREYKGAMSIDSKRERAVIAAGDLFMRYGFARTTMGDIAAAAEMSRPALYLLLPGKEEAFEAAVLHLNTQRLKEIRAALAQCTGLAQRLFKVCELWLIVVFELKATTPDARDMDNLSFSVVRKVYADLQALLAELIEQTVPGPLPATPMQFARNLVFSIRGLGATAVDGDDMRAMTRLQIDQLCAALGQDTARI